MLENLLVLLQVPAYYLFLYGWACSWRTYWHVILYLNLYQLSHTDRGMGNDCGSFLCVSPMVIPSSHVFHSVSVNFIVILFYPHVHIMCEHECILAVLNFPFIISSYDNVYSKCSMVQLGTEASELIRFENVFTIIHSNIYLCIPSKFRNFSCVYVMCLNRDQRPLFQFLFFLGF